jgi:transposase
LLLREPQFSHILRMDVSSKALEFAAERLHLDRLPAKQRERVELIQGSLMYRDPRFNGFDAAVVEVIEHLDPPRLAAFERVLFEFARPKTVVLTTPAKLDLSFLRDLVKRCYSTSMGRPSIDPVVFFKLQLIMFFEGIRSERQLMEIVNLNLAHRWYIGYDLDEDIPDHSSLTKIRDRYGLETFQRFFDNIVEQCIEAGLVWGQELYFDGTNVQANADIDTMVPRFYFEAKQQMKALFG